ncbi:MAG: hypothetical protein H8E05_00130 [Bacteroidetes bacterium]|nr:hypothetical protein [Bacteroidota bacterium]
MMNTPAYILTDNSLTVVVEGKAHTMNSNHPSWQRAVQDIKDENWDNLPFHFDVASAVEDYVDGNIEVKDGAVYYKGEVVDNHVVDRLLSFMRENLPYKPLVRFLDKLMDNPSQRATNELYRFLEHKNMPLTPEGNFLAYKGVNHDFTDKYTGKFSNAVGQTLEMSRNTVCDDANIGCSSGFHAGSHEYAKGYASGGGNLMVVEISPADVVSVPHDCDCQKLRTTKYKVVGHMETIDTPLDDGLNEDYYDYEDDYDNDGEVDEYNEGYFAGVAATKKEMADKLGYNKDDNN